MTISGKLLNFNLYSYENSLFRGPLIFKNEFHDFMRDFKV